VDASATWARPGYGSAIIWIPLAICTEAVLKMAAMSAPPPEKKKSPPAFSEVLPAEVPASGREGGGRLPKHWRWPSAQRKGSNTSAERFDS